MKISIIIPVYNAEKYISRCIESVLAQTFTDWELILVDDGSKDSSLSICESFANTNSRIKIISQKNSGPSAARNKGLEIAKGEYICFIDADDWIENCSLSDYINEIDNTNSDIVFQGFIDEYPNGEKKYNLISVSNENTKKDIISLLYENRCFGWSWNKIFKKEIIEKYNIRFDESVRLWEDELFTIEFLHHSDNIKVINKCNYHYIVYENSLMHNPPNEIIKFELRKKINTGLLGIINEELKNSITNKFDKEYKYTMLMACMNKPGYICSYEYKKQLIFGYYRKISDNPEIRRIMVLKNKRNSLIAELLLASHCPSLIIKILGLL